MSGGHFSFAFMHIRSFSEELALAIQNNDVAEDDGAPQGHDPQTLARLAHTTQITGVIAKLMRHAEWLYEGDHSPETFAELHDEAMAELKALMEQA